MGGSNAKNVLDDSLGKQVQDANTKATFDPRLQQAIQNYKSSGDLNTAISSATPGASDMDRTAITNQMYSDPSSGSAIATQQAQNNPLMSGFLGKGGIQDQRQADESDLTKNAYNWNAQDATALGTAQAGINRQYGADQGAVTRALASKGFGSADSGLAGAQFSGLAGNTSDRLASAQQSLANNRMQVGMQRLGAARAAVNQAQGISNASVNDQFTRNQEGLGRTDAQGSKSWNQSLGQQAQQNAEWQQQQDSSINPGKIAAGLATGAVGVLGGAATGSLAGSLGLGAKPTNTSYDINSLYDSNGNLKGTGSSTNGLQGTSSNKGY